MESEDEGGSKARIKLHQYGRIMSYIATKYVSVDVPFFDFPLGLNLQQRWNEQEQAMDFYVHRIVRATESTNYVKQGYILKKINSNPIEQPTLDELNDVLRSYKGHVSPKKPLVITFKVFDKMGEGTPLFDPFHNVNEASSNDMCLDQKVQKYEHDDMNIKMTTFPQPSQPQQQQQQQQQGQRPLVSGNAIQGQSGGSGGIQGASQWLNANDVINANDLVKHMVNCDSDFRTDNSDSTTNFVINLNRKIKNVIRIRLASVEIPNTSYAFSVAKHNTEILLVSELAGTAHVFEVFEGNYSAQELVDALNTTFTTTNVMPGYQISLNTTSATVTISTKNLTPFTMDFRNVLNSTDLNDDLQQDMKYNWGLGYNLGFRKKLYEGQSSYESEAIINTIGDQYYFLQVNDYNSITQPFPDGTILEAFTKLIMRNDKNTEIFNDSSDLLTRDYVFKQPTDIYRLHIRIVDKYNKSINLLDAGISLSLEITEVMNCSLYDFYRNSLVQRRIL